ncbi:MAG: hypothetical protein ACLU07_01835 [Lachnospirales bacterium]
MNVGTQEMYSEVYSILNLLGSSYITKLPKSLFKMIEEEKSSTYNLQYSEDQSLSEQNIKRESLSMIALFHLNYWCNSDEEKEQLKQLLKNNEEKHQAEIREKYNPDNLFKNNKQETIQEANVNSNNLAIVEYKESILKKFINKIKSLLHLG